MQTKSFFLVYIVCIIGNFFHVPFANGKKLKLLPFRQFLTDCVRFSSIEIAWMSRFSNIIIGIFENLHQFGVIPVDHWVKSGKSDPTSASINFYPNYLNESDS